MLRDLIEPLCVAALNTPMAQASAAVFLRVLRDALFSGPGGADLLLPCRPLSDLLPSPAEAWLSSRGAALRTTANPVASAMTPISMGAVASVAGLGASFHIIGAALTAVMVLISLRVVRRPEIDAGAREG